MITWCQLSDVIYTEEACVKVGPHLFAILTVGFISTNAALAAHRPHHFSAVAHSGHYVSKESPTSGSSGDSALEPVKTGRSSDSVRDRGPGHDLGQSAKTDNSANYASKRNFGKSQTTGDTTDTAPNREHHHDVTPGIGLGNKEGPEATSIDISITVNQRPVSRRNVRHHFDRNAKTGRTTKTARSTSPEAKRRHALTHPREIHFASHRGSHRNAIGARVEQERADHGQADAHYKMRHDRALEQKPPEHDKAIDLPNSVVHRDSAPTTSPVTHGLDAGLAGRTTIEQLSPNASKTARISGLSISGTDSFRPRFDTGAVGGPAQINKININTGVLSGNMFHPRHP
jgi:hypothetical protein